MADFFCIYSGKMCSEEERSKEHIIPYALGGSNNFVTEDVSKAANNRAGSTVDSDLVNHRFMSFQRWLRGIASDDGRIPAWKSEGVTEVDGKEREVSFYVKPGGSTNLRLRPLVEYDLKTMEFSITCHPDEVADIRRNLERKGRKEGLNFTLDDSNCIRRDIHTENPLVHSRYSVDVEQMFRGIVKIVIGAGHWLLGSEWSRSSHAACLRSSMWSPKPWDEKRYSAIGRIWPATGSNLQGMTQQIYVGQDFHVLLLSNMGQLSCLLLLFGRFDALIQLGPGGWQLSALPPGEMIVLVVDTRTRKLWQFSFCDFVGRKMHAKLPFDADYAPPDAEFRY